MKQLALYLHFPFCKSKCYYCDFNSYSGQDELIEAYGESILIDLACNLPGDYEISSVYFGGGTPSYFPTELLRKILWQIKEKVSVKKGAEVTLEVNPGTVGLQALSELYQAGFNRLSLGLQATQDCLLQRIGRIHSFQEFVTVFHEARTVGFENLGIDLIFGLPEQTLTQWQESLTEVVKLAPEHISAYGLQLEADTPLAKMVELGSVALPNEAEVVAMMQLAMHYLPAMGYHHYEISNYAKLGKESQHNLAYWHGVDYLGFGAGAVSTFEGERWQNPPDPLAYIQGVAGAAMPRLELETIDTKIAAVEELMLGLRLTSGLDLEQYQARYQINLTEKLAPELSSLIGQKLLQLEEGRLLLTEKGIFLSNQVIGRLIEYLT